MEVIVNEENEITLESFTNDTTNKMDIIKRNNSLVECPSIDIEFQDLGYSVPDLTGKKTLLRGISGKFKSSQLTVILGPSGAGKTTLLNVLAGYRTSEPTGSILINGQKRNMKTFRKLSRYIMQEDLYQPMLTINEAMMIAADLKLGRNLTKAQKRNVINETLELLRLTSAADTLTHLLSGGERKRLSIALELIDNPPVILLDEPTTGLDDLSCTQCMTLLQRIAHGGRTIICSIHTPSAKLFKMFDRVYVMSDGQCVYQGSTISIVDYMHSVGLNCPVYYNPADFVMEVSCGEYGYEHIDRMVEKIENGKYYWTPERTLELTHLHKSKIISNRNLNDNTTNGTNFNTNGDNSFNNQQISNNNNNNNNNQNSNDSNNNNNNEIELFYEEIDSKYLKSNSSNWYQFVVLFRRRILQTCRDTTYTKLRVSMTLILGILVGFVYQGFGNDASKAIFNFGLCFTFTIAFLYIPLMPMLLQFPAEVQLLKREHFNHWFRMGPYYTALIASKLPMNIGLTFAYIVIVYFMSSQPLEYFRIGMFYSISLLIGLTSESLGIIVASRFSLVNGMFIGPVSAVPLILLSVYGIGFGKETPIPMFIKILRSFSYLRYGVEGIIAAMYSYDRANTICPDSEMYCIFANSKFLRNILGFEDASWGYAIIGLSINYLIFTIIGYYLLKFRISTTASNYLIVQYVSRFIKKYLNFSTPKL